ncbi:MAG: hypothetical protein Q9164_007484, partial [Protoblastenia rupestris]
YFWNVGRAQIMLFYASFLGCWAGSPIINLGDGVEAGDIPAGLKMEGWEEILRKRPSLDDVGPSQLAPLSLLDYAQTRFESVNLLIKLPVLDKMLTRLKKKHKLPTHLYPGLTNIISPQLIDYYPADRVWILRNLTTGEYVRPEGFTVDPKYARGPHIGGVGFGEIVLLRCSWSSSSRGTGLPYPHSLHRGIWAGHRLDITTFDRLTERCSRPASQWKDISEEVTAEVDEIWSMQFTADWKTDIKGVLVDEQQRITGELLKSRVMELNFFWKKGCLIHSPHGPDYES